MVLKYELVNVIICTGDIAMEQELVYKDLNFDGINWSKDSLEIMEDMLAVWDSGHRIVICHPNQVFLHKPISQTNTDIKSIDWLELAEDASFHDSDSFMNIYPYIEDSWKYIHRRFRHELFDNKKVQSPRHLVVIEYDRYDGCLVRGIIRADENSIKIAENPLYAEYKPKSIWEKQLRWTADDEIYLKQYIASKTGGSQTPPQQ